MKKIITIIFLILTATATDAQPRTMGIRFGATGLEASYEHRINSKRFVQCDLGLDYGYNLNGNVGAKIAATYNFILARPTWTTAGCWEFYMGPGIAVGFTDDIVPYQTGRDIRGYYDSGLMVALAVQAGVEYMFDFPLALAIDVRPYFGVHVNDGLLKDPHTGTRVRFGSKTGFYDNGLLGFVPSISVRYRF